MRWIWIDKFVEFESGKARTFQKNSVNKKRHSFMLDLIDDGVDGEYATFVNWWDYNLASGSLSFFFPDLITHSGNTEYRPTGQYSAVGQKHKEVTIEVEEM